MENHNDTETQAELSQALKQLRRIFLTIGLFSFFLNILMLVAPFYMLVVYDIVMPAKNTETLILVTLIALLFFIGIWLLDYVRSKLMIYTNNRLDTILNRRIFDATFELAAKYPNKADIQPIRDFNTIKSFLGGNAVFAFFDFPWFPIYLTIMFFFSIYYGLYGVVATAIILLLTWLNEKATKEGLSKSNAQMREASRFLEHNIRNVEVVKALGMKNNIHSIWREKHYAYLRTHAEASQKAAFYSNASKSFRMFSTSMMYGVGALLAIGGLISPGMIIAGAVLLGRALQPITQIVATWKSFSSAKIAYGKLSELLEEFPPSEKKTALPEPQGDIRLEQVVTVPPLSKKPVLKGISLHIEKGTVVGVIGPSAAGKSSLAKTVVGVWEPVSGTVRIDGADIRHYDHEVLGRHLGYLPQDIELFEGTVAQNISRFDPDATDEAIVEAAKLSGTHALILSLPDGYNTKIGVGGTALSGGQKQRIGLARALYGNPRIVVLDEPNSNLDDAGERALIEAVRTLKRNGVTVVFITHKSGLIGLADKLLVLRDGHILRYDEKDKVLAFLRGESHPSTRSES